MTNIVGYARVSTSDQNLGMQIEALKSAGASKIFSDHGVSGTRASRPELDKAIEYLREGDVLTVWKLDRLGRSTVNVLKLISDLTERGIGFRSLTEGLDVSGAMGTALLTIMSAIAQLERDQLIERTNAGLASARAQGRVGGRPKSLDLHKVEVAQDMYDKGNTVKVIASTLGVAPATVYRYIGS